jgi:hypothetical protein
MHGASTSSFQGAAKAVIFFANYENCHAYMVDAYMVYLRWPDGKVTCPHCGSSDGAWLPNAKVFKRYLKHDRQNESHRGKSTALSV